MQCLTIDEIVALEPGIGTILREARSNAHRRESIDDLYRWYKGILSRLVGWSSSHETLRDAGPYETVIKALCEALDY